MSHATHANAALTPRARLRLARLIVDEGWSDPRGPPSATTCRGRPRRSGPTATAAEGPAGMGDRSSRPHRQPNRTPAAGGAQDRAPALEAAAGAGRDRRPARACRPRPCTRSWSGAGSTGSPTSTAPPVSRSAATSTSTPATCSTSTSRSSAGSPMAAAGATSAAQQGWRNRAATAARTGAPQSKYRQPLIGTCFLHTVIDDHSRVAYVEAHDDETKETATEVLRNAVAWFADRGVTVQRVLSDNGGCYRSLPLARDLRRARHHPEADPALPTADQRQDRALPPHPGRGLGVQEVLQLRVSPTRRSASMGPRVQPPPAPLGHRQSAHPSPGWTTWLGITPSRGKVPVPSGTRLAAAEAGRRPSSSFGLWNGGSLTASIGLVIERREVTGPGGQVGAALSSSAANRSPMVSTSDRPQPGPVTTDHTPAIR